MGGPHLAGELINLLAGVNILHIPYKGNGPAAVAILTGEAQLMFGTGPSVVPHIDNGKLRALATTGPKRTMKDLPTMAEILPGYEVTQWYGVLVPAGTSKDIVTRLQREIVTAVSNPKNAQALIKLGTAPVSTTPEEFAAFIRSETSKYAKVIKAAKITAE
jgi:tripartite-type tricarboxylate transporter receptor subunit TctC